MLNSANLSYCDSSKLNVLKNAFVIILISAFSLTFSSCSSEDAKTSADNSTSTSTEDTSTTDTTAPTLAEVTAVTTPNNDSTPNYTFSSDESGTITYGGSCYSSTTSATSGNNTITLSTLSDGTYTDCTISVKDSAGNTSNTLTITSFVIDATAAILLEVTVVTTPTSDNTPDYTFSSSESGTITYGGSCSSSTTSATSGNNTITFNTLSTATYSDCTLNVTDSAGNISSTLTVSTFVIITDWKQESYLKATNNDAGDEFGGSVSISGDTLVVGANFEDSGLAWITNDTTASSSNSSSNSGAVYVYKRSGTSWIQEAYIKTINNDAHDSFGYFVTIDNDTLVVGVRTDSSAQTNIYNDATTKIVDDTNGSSGAVYVYKRSGTNWVREAFIKASNNDESDYFGSVVSIDKDTLVVGTYKEDSNQTTITNGTTASSDNSNTKSGAVYVYKRTGTSWAQEAYIKPVNNVNNNGDENFGWSVSISGDTLAVGSIGEDSNQSTITNGTTASSDNSLPSSGAVYVYKRTGTNWVQEAYIKAVNSDVVVEFGSSVSISDDTIAVGAHGERSNQTTITNGTSASSDNSISGSGAVYVYKRTGTNWAQEAYIKAVNNDVVDWFGKYLTLSEDTLVVGVYMEDSNQTTITNGTTASSDNSNSNSGAVYVYKRTGTNWAQEAYIKAVNNDADDQFGKTVSISGNTIVVGAANEDSNEATITNGTTASSDNSSSNSGAVYVYTR
jgi:hypothetical protein